MKPKERQAYILEKVRQEKFASVDDLSKIFSVTVQSIRKDVNDLCRKGLLRRVYGGVEIPSSNENISYNSRKIIHYDEKRSIAKHIAKYIKDNSSLFFSIGTTPEIIAKELTLEKKNLKIFTNNLNVALVCCENPSFEVVLHGGIIRNKHRDILGENIESFFSQYRVDFGIFGVGAIKEDGSLLDFTHGEIHAREAIRKYCKKSFLVADNSKFKRDAHIRGGNITDIDLFISNKKPPETICNLLENTNTEYSYDEKEGLQ